MQAEIRTGPVIVGDGSINPARGGRSGEVSVADAHARYLESNFRGAVYSGGMTTTSISNATYTTLTATTTPVIGVWNPSTNNVNLVVISASLSVVVTAATATGCGGFVWASSVGNTAISTGNNPLNRKTLVATGSSAKDMTNVALTGLTNNMTVKFGSALNGGLIKNISSVETAVGQNIGIATSATEQFDGTLIVPPGGVVALICTTTPVGHSAASSIVWEEVPI